MVAPRSKCLARSVTKLTLQIFTDVSREGWGANSGDHMARETWSLLESKLHINYLELKAVFLALKEFKTSIQER